MDEVSGAGVHGADVAAVVFMTGRLIHRRDEGFGLAEALVASGLLVTLSVGLAHLTAMTSRAIERAAGESTGLLLAVQKMEQLRSLAWTHDGGRAWSAAGAGVVSDVTTNLTTDPPTPNGRGLRLSPADALARNTPGYVDYLDHAGQWVGTGARPPAGTVFVRRWSVSGVATARGDLLVLQVLVMPLGMAIRTIGLRPGPHEPGVVWLTTLRTRQ